MDVSSPRDVACAESAAACIESAAASALSVAASSERASMVADKTGATAETATTDATTSATKDESARAAVCAADVALALVEAIHTKIKDAPAKIFQATLESCMQPMFEKATEAMEHLLPHEITERELDMQEVARIKKHREEELRVVEDGV
ncbi:DNA-directed RNA polymerase II subunit RPB1 [Hordeum vulgare]|nr:DNA-directed RNA polymerase II subunit RPB1 [Hordeum vulgare]